MNVRGDFLKTPHSTNTTALICKSRKEPSIKYIKSYLYFITNIKLTIRLVTNYINICNLPSFYSYI